MKDIVRLMWRLDFKLSTSVVLMSLRKLSRLDLYGDIMNAYTRTKRWYLINSEKTTAKERSHIKKVFCTVYIKAHGKYPLWDKKADRSLFYASSKFGTPYIDARINEIIQYNDIPPLVFFGDLIKEKGDYVCGKCKKINGHSAFCEDAKMHEEDERKQTVSELINLIGELYGEKKSK